MASSLGGDGSPQLAHLIPIQCLHQRLELFGLRRRGGRRTGQRDAIKQRVALECQLPPSQHSLALVTDFGRYCQILAATAQYHVHHVQCGVPRRLAHHVPFVLLIHLTRELFSVQLPTLCAQKTKSRHKYFNGCVAEASAGLRQKMDNNKASLSASRSIRQSTAGPQVSLA